MKLHTKLSEPEVRFALEDAKRAGLVTPDVFFVEWGHGHSRTHGNRYEVQLGTYDQLSLPAGTVDQYGKAMKVRRFKNPGSGENHQLGYYEPKVWAATYFEWGWFMANIFARDPEAVFGSPNPKSSSWGYKGVDDFNEKTENRFEETRQHLALGGDLEDKLDLS